MTFRRTLLIVILGGVGGILAVARHASKTAPLPTAPEMPPVDVVPASLAAGGGDTDPPLVAVTSGTDVATSGTAESTPPGTNQGLKETVVEPAPEGVEPEPMVADGAPGKISSEEILTTSGTGKLVGEPTPAAPPHQTIDFDSVDVYLQDVEGKLRDELP